MDNISAKQVSIFLSSGHTVTFVCDEFTIEKNMNTGKYTGYTIEGSREYVLLSLSLPEIVGCAVKIINE